MTTERLQTLDQVRKLIKSARQYDWLFGCIGLLCLMLGVISFATLFIEMLSLGLERLRPEFFSNFPSRRAVNAGILSAWVGSLLVMLVTAFTAVPLGIASGVYLEEYADKNWFTDVIEINVTNLAGVPSIVYGLLALGVFVYGFGFGQSVLTAGLTLGLLILPIVIVATRESIRSIPQHIREGSYGLGATRWQTIRDHILPYSSPGILTGVIIGMSRAIGETAPIINFDWLFSGFTVMPIQMFNWTSRPEEAFQRNAAAAGFVLVLMTLSMNAVAIWLRYRLRKNLKW
jgi:phosphate transport system permease protein